MVTLNLKYFVLADTLKRNSAWACTQGEKIYTDKELIESAIKHNSLGVDFVLTKMTRTKDGSTRSADLAGIKHLWLDFPPNNLAYNLMSSKMQEVIASCLTGEEGVTWVPVKVIGPEEKRTYYIPRFTKKLDILDKEKTSFTTWEDGEKSVVVPCFSYKRIKNYSVFHSPRSYWELSKCIYVSASLRAALIGADLTGVAFENARVSYD